MPIRHKPFERGAELTQKDSTTIPADSPLYPLRDQIIIEPLETVYSAILEILHESKPIHGIVKAVGPGCYPKKYDHPDKHRRTKMWDSAQFRRTKVKVGDRVGFGGFNFQTFYWGDKLHLVMREEDLIGIYPEEVSAVDPIRPPDWLEARTAS